MEILVAVVCFGVFLVGAVKLIIHLYFTDSEKEYPKDIVILCQMPRRKDTPNMIPYTVKLETYLRMAKIPYQNVYSRKVSPKHKSPFIIFNGQVVSDSQFIIEFLNKKFHVDLNKQLTRREKAISHAMRKMTEESLIWTFVLELWITAFDKAHVLNGLPRNPYDLWKTRTQFFRNAYGQGSGRHTKQELEVLCRQDLQALSDQIGKSGFLMGNQPCEADCAVFGMLGMMWLMSESSFCTKIVKDNVYPNLATYQERMKKEFWPDFVLDD